MAATANDILEHLKQRILVIDGSMGVLLQSRGLTETDYRGARFADHPKDVRNNPDLLNRTAPRAWTAWTPSGPPTGTKIANK